MTLRFTAALVSLLLSSTVARAQAASEAQAEHWIVIPSTVGETGNPAHLSRKAAQRLTDALDAQGRPMLTREQAQRSFEQRGSAPPMQATASDVDALARDAQQALYHVASGLYSRAQSDVARVMTRARGALESLNRESRAARHLLDACMYLVRGHLERHDRTEARRQALECRRLVPDIQPDSTMHPPDVIGVLAEAEAELLSREPSSLRIESEPMGCAALVNGRNLGTTPKELPRLSPGEYRVQVECHDGEPGRVHRAMLSSNRVVTRVDTRFDRAVQTAFDLSLRYQDAADEQSYDVHDAIEAARTVGASDLVLTRLRAGGASAVQVEAVRLRVSDGAQIASTMLGFDASGELAKSVLDGAVHALLDAKAPPLIAAPAVAADAEPPAPAQAAQEPAPLQLAPAAVGAAAAEVERDEAPADDHHALETAGWVIAGVGVAADITGWVLYARLASLQSDYTEQQRMQSEGRFEAEREVRGFDLAPKLTLGIGAVLWSASMPMWLPRQRGVPFWAWIAGGVGLVGAGAGAKLALDAGSCVRDEFDRCTEPALATGLGVQLLLQALPLLTLPSVYIVRALTGSEGQAQLAFEAGPASVGVRYSQAL